MHTELELTGKIWIGGDWCSGHTQTDIRDKFSGQEIARVEVPAQAQIGDSVAAARAAFLERQIEPYERGELLLRVRKFLVAHRPQIVDIMIAETGFTKRDVDGDFDRSLQTLRLSAEEATRICGDVVPIQGAKGQADRVAYTIREPVGVVCAITPFNSPLNTVCHKIAPAIAAGNAVILKPSLHTPVTAEALCRAFEASGLPRGMLNLLHGDGDVVGVALLKEPDIDYYTFTGSTRVGKIIQQFAGLRRTQLELGNISGTIVCADSRLENAAQKCVNASFRKAGQVCTSVQRLYVQRSVLDEFAEMLVAGAAALKVGDPHDDATDIGPMISEAAARRAEDWINEAVAGGARLLCGGKRNGCVLEPAILMDVDASMRVVCEEIFAPVVSLIPFDEIGEAIEMVNATPFGLAAGIFTDDIHLAMRAARAIRVGSLHINDTSSSRVDQMPYGGVKESGFGHEGPKYAIRDMTEERLITIVPVH